MSAYTSPHEYNTAAVRNQTALMLQDFRTFFQYKNRHTSTHCHCASAVAMPSTGVGSFLLFVLRPRPFLERLNAPEPGAWKAVAAAIGARLRQFSALGQGVNHDLFEFTNLLGFEASSYDRFGCAVDRLIFLQVAFLD